MGNKNNVDSEQCKKRQYVETVPIILIKESLKELLSQLQGFVEWKCLLDGDNVFGNRLGSVLGKRVR